MLDEGGIGSRSADHQIGTLRHVAEGFEKVCYTLGGINSARVENHGDGRIDTEGLTLLGTVCVGDGNVMLGVDPGRDHRHPVARQPGNPDPSGRRVG